MKRTFALFSVLLILFTLILFPQEANAADGTVTVSASISGQTVTVNVGISPATEMENFNCSVSYASNVIEFVSGASSIGAAVYATGGSVNIAKDIGSAFTAGPVATLTFKVKGSGNINFTASEGYGASIYEGNFTFSGSSASINIQNAPAATPTTTTAPVAPAQTPLTPAETIAPTTTTTTNTSDTTLTTTTEETTTETTLPFKATDHAGRSLAIADIDVEELDIPSGFISEERLVNGNSLNGYYSESEDLFLAVLSPSDGEPGFYFYNDDTEYFIPYLRFVLDEKLYHVTFMPDKQMPFATTRADAEIKGVNLPVLEINTGDYISLDEYMQEYQEFLSEREAADTSAGSTAATSSDGVIPINVEVESKDSSIYLLALQGKDKKIERFFYSSNLDQLLPYELLIVPVFGTFLDENFSEAVVEEAEETALQTESVSEATAEAESEQDSSILNRKISLFSRDFKLWQIILAALLILLIIVLVLIGIIRSSSSGKRAEYLFADELTGARSEQESEDENYTEEDLDADNFRSVNYYNPDDFPEVRDISDISLQDEYLSEEYQGNDHYDKEDSDDREEI